MNLSHLIGAIPRCCETENPIPDGDSPTSYALIVSVRVARVLGFGRGVSGLSGLDLDSA
jgi:hypothetical protein